MNKIPISKERLELAARMLCEMRGLDPASRAFVPDWKYPVAIGLVQPVKEATALDAMMHEISVYIQVLTAVEHAYITIPDEGPGIAE